MFSVCLSDCECTYSESNSLCEFPSECLVDCAVCSGLRESVVVDDLPQVAADLLRSGDGLRGLLNGVLGLGGKCIVGVWT